MKKKIIGICGSMKKVNSSSEYLLSVALDAASGPEVETELIRLDDYKIYQCEGCGNCMNGKHCKLLDNKDDQLTELYNKLCEADGFIFSSPVYALSLPAMWKNWIDRCEPCTDEDLNFDYYNYDRAVDVKGKAFKGKVAGQIVVAAGPGHELAMSSLIPNYTCIKLSMVASAGMSLIEYDGQPGIREKSWSKPIQEAEFAKMMARSVGIRVAAALGFSYFDTVPNKKLSSDNKTDDLFINNLDDAKIKVNDLIESDPFIMIIGSQSTSLQVKEVNKKISSVLNGKGKCIMIATVDNLPPFITRDFVKEKISKIIGVKDLYIDWDNQINDIYKIPQDKICLLVCGKDKKWSLVEWSDQINIEDVIKKVE